MRPTPISPDELIAELTAIFPGFTIREEPDDETPATYHSVFLFEFNPFFGRHVEEFTPKQLKSFAQLLARCTSVPGSLQNAIDTCFLEHTRQMKANRHLSKYLKEAVRELQ